MIIVSDTTSLIILEKLEALDLLCRLFKRAMLAKYHIHQSAIKDLAFQCRITYLYAE